MHPVLFHLGNFPVRAYGTLLVIGFLIGLGRATRLAAHRMQTEPEGSPRRISPEAIQDIGLLGLFFGIFGARLLFVLQDWRNFQQDPLSLFRVWEGGLSLHGGMLFGILLLMGYCRKKGISLLAAGDMGVPSWAIAYAIGRLGCLLNGCCYGSECDLPWAVRFPDERFPNQSVLTPPSHPVQLYGTLINIGLFFWLLWWERRPRRDGEMFFGYLAMYGAYRFAMEAFRAGATSTYLVRHLHLTDTHLVSVAMVLLGLGGILWLRRTRQAVG